MPQTLCWSYELISCHAGLGVFRLLILIKPSSFPDDWMGSSRNSSAAFRWFLSVFAVARTEIKQTQNYNKIKSGKNCPLFLLLQYAQLHLLLHQCKDIGHLAGWYIMERRKISLAENAINLVYFIKFAPIAKRNHLSHVLFFWCALYSCFLSTIPLMQSVNCLQNWPN